MAGHRRAVNGQQGRPTRAAMKHERRASDLAERLGRARTPNDRISASADIIRRAVVDMTSELAEVTAAEVVQLARVAMRRARPDMKEKIQ